MNLRIGHLSTFYHTAVLLMDDEDLPGRLGAQVQWSLFGTGPAIVEAFRAGEIDMAYIGLPPAMVGMADGVSIRCIAGGHMEGTVFVGMSGDLGYPRTKDLGKILAQYKGKRIGVPGTGSIHDVILRDALLRYDLLDTVEVVHFPWADAIIEALRAGDVAAAAGTTALGMAVRRYVRGKLLYPADLLWPENPSYGIVASTEFIAAHSDLLSRFIEIHEDALAFIRSRPRVASGKIASTVGTIDEDFVMDTLRISPKFCAQLTEEYMASTERFVPVMSNLGLIKHTLERDDIFDTALVTAVHAPGSHYRNGINLCGETQLLHPSLIDSSTP